MLCLSLGLAGGIYAGMHVPRPAVSAAHFAGVPEDPEALAIALETLGSGEAFSDFDQCSGCRIVPVSTLRTATGTYCREYDATSGTASAHGLACRHVDGQWRTEYLLGGEILRSAPTTMGKVPSMSAALGESHPLSAADEALAIHKRWMK